MNFELPKARYESAQPFSDFLATVDKNADLWRAVYRRATVQLEVLDRVVSLGGRWHLLILNEDWCGDAVNVVPILAKLAELAPNLDLRLLSRDENPDIMDAHLTGTSRSIPVVMLLDDDFRERGWWGPRPSELQGSVTGEWKALPKEERYRNTRQWYARDRGRTTLDEVIDTIARASAVPDVPGASVA